MNLTHLSDPKYPLKLLKCKKCFQATSTPPERHPSYNQCYTLFCSNPECMEFWYVCQQHSLRFASSKFGKLRSHFINIDHDSSVAPDAIAGVCVIAEIHKDNDQYEASKNLNYMSSDEVFAEAIDSDDSTSKFSNSEEIIPMTKRPKLIHESNKDSSSSTLFESNLSCESKRYFDDDVNNPGSGVCGLVARAFRQNNDSTVFANKKEANLQLNITHFCSS